ncbi:hydantoin utilization protein [Bdellovibrio bacteriovorus]|uniref:hydantoin utilization protein n=1 Tax=Bdellovibrio bacteriovorus TaxID=959 RepID=UPI0035A61EE4
MFHSRESLKSSLNQFIAPHGKIQKAFISLRVPKKLLDYKLSGAVAHVSTEGLEHWLDLCGTPAALTSKDLQFALRERVRADGSVETPLQIEDLEAIAAKLELMSCKKICLNLLHAATNPVHLNAAAKFFTEKGIEVFAPASTDNPHEVTRWTQNALNATLSGVFADLKKDILAGLESAVEKENVYFLDGNGDLFQNESGKEISSLFAATTALGLWNKSRGSDVLYLGLEYFTLISPTRWAAQWNSCWGSVEVRHLKTKNLGIQPTLGIGLNSFDRFDFTTVEEGWEPGPMFLGRGQKMCLLDLWSENPKLSKLEGLEDRVSAQGIQRFKTSLLTLSKISTFKDNDFTHLTKELQSLSVQRLAVESFLQRDQQKLLVTGPLAALFANIFKKDPHTTVAADEFCESAATALWGMQAMKESK